MQHEIEELQLLTQALVDHMEAVLKILGLEIGRHRRPQPATTDEGELLHSVWDGTWCGHPHEYMRGGGYYSFNRSCSACGRHWKRASTADTPWDLVRGEPHLQE